MPNIERFVRPFGDGAFLQRLVTPGQRQSPFLESVLEITASTAVNWTTLPFVTVEDNGDEKAEENAEVERKEKPKEVKNPECEDQPIEVMVVEQVKFKAKPKKKPKNPVAKEDVFTLLFKSGGGGTPAGKTPQPTR